jgi:putative ABC transport system permease protein
LHSKLRFEPEVNGDAKSVHFLMIIAAFILILAWVNYINLSTSRSLMRAKEVGVKKVLGSQRSQLVRQFIVESLMLNGLAFMFALVLVEFVSPYFNQLTD